MRTPVFVGLNVLDQSVREVRKLQEEVLGLLQLWDRTTYLTPSVYELFSVQILTALVTLVSARALIAAVRAFALNISVRQESLAVVAEELWRRLLLKMPLL